MKKKNTTIKKKTTNMRKSSKRKTSLSDKADERRKKNIYIILFALFCLGVLLIVAVYAWLSTALNVKVKTFNMVVTKNEGLTISFDAIHYDNSVEISRDALIDNLTSLYPNHKNQWATNGLIPVSSPGVTNPNQYFFDIYKSSGVNYRDRKKEKGFVVTELDDESEPRHFSYFIAFDLFLKNDSGSPVSDHLFLDDGTGVEVSENASEEMLGLVNSIRFGFVKVGSVPLNTDPTTVQNIQCNNDCVSTIYEPRNLDHTSLSIERAKKYGIHLEDQTYFPTYAFKRSGGPFRLTDIVSGAANMDFNYFQLQETKRNLEFDTPLFMIPNGITKMRVYVWIEGQDIDSLETNSEGTDVDLSINFAKDTYGYDFFDE